MPDNPDVKTLVNRATAARKAQEALRASMAAVAADAKTPATVKPAAGSAR